MNIRIEDKVDLEEIGDKNTQQYVNVCSLVDNFQFLKKVKQVREALGLRKMLSYKNAKKWINTRRKYIKKNPDANYPVNDRYMKLLLCTSNLKQRFRRGDSFTDVIKYTILCGKVTDNELPTKTSYCFIYPFEDEYTLELDSPMVAILIDQETQLEEVEKLIKTKARILFKQIDKSRKLPKREHDELIRHRKWYWQHYALKMSYNKIASEDGCISKQGVVDALEDYTKLVGFKPPVSLKKAL
ncbi:hypothetical protein GYA37_00090 [candidate division WWE3 bacterium]|uniref:Uncharacterized protein n=1 Tax=candidate division WWE3 bacterium TaxID=2053526 RepID=A0A7X9E688_UNCKA|nr:hypothetical protein [candidate division WWE3 bacterium]